MSFNRGEAFAIFALQCIGELGRFPVLALDGVRAALEAVLL